MNYNVPPAPPTYDQFWASLLEIATETAFKASSTGEIFYHAGTPENALACDGSDVSRTTYETLFDVIGTTYGAGDGSTTFTLPDVADLTVSNGTDATAYIRT